MITRSVQNMSTGGLKTRQSSITASARTRGGISPNSFGLSKERRAFAAQLARNASKKTTITAATNTSNIMARPDFLELLPLFVQKLLILDVFGSIAMKSRQQLVPYFKFISENSKGETPAGTVLSSPFVNRQGMDPNFTGRAVRNEIIGQGTYDNMMAQYTPILPGSVTVTAIKTGVSTPIIDDGAGNLKNAEGTVVGYIDYSTGNVIISDEGTKPDAEGQVKITYQYDNETVGPDVNGNYGAKMGKGYLQLDEFNMVAEAHQLSSYWSIYSAFAAQQEYGSNIGDLAKEAAFSELTAEINSQGFDILANAAKIHPQFNWDASPVMSGSVVPSDYLNMFKLKLGQAAAYIYQKTRLAHPNRLVVGTNVAEYLAMVQGFQGVTTEGEVGPYKLGTLNQFEIFVAPDYDPNKWVMCCKSQDIRRNSALFGEYMPLVNTEPIGLSNASVQQGYATMYAMKVVNPDTVVSGKIVGTF